MLAEKLWSFRRSPGSSVLGIGWQERAELVLPFRVLQGRCEGAIRVASVYILANESFIGPFGRAVSEYFAPFGSAHLDKGRCQLAIPRRG